MRSHVYLVLEQLLDPLTEWSHKVLSQQAKVRVKVDVCVCVASRGEVGSEEGSVVLLELLRGWVDGYSPEILLLFLTWVRNFNYLMSLNIFDNCLTNIPTDFL